MGNRGVKKRRKNRKIKKNWRGEKEN